MHSGFMPESKPLLRLELQELLLVALGALPGALLRWQVELHLKDQNLLVNTLGAALLGLLAGLPVAARRQLLLGIGFCGSVTTFSSWMLAAMKHLSAGDWGAALGLMEEASADDIWAPYHSAHIVFKD